MTVSYYPTFRSWNSKRWEKKAVEHGCMMWNHRDEEWFQEREKRCIAGGDEGQPISNKKWKKGGIGKFKLDIPFEEYCRQFLERELSHGL